jgi:hypothetical protein
VAVDPVVVARVPALPLAALVIELDIIDIIEPLAPPTGAVGAPG